MHCLTHPLPERAAAAACEAISSNNGWLNDVAWIFNINVFGDCLLEMHSGYSVSQYINLMSFHFASFTEYN